MSRFRALVVVVAAVAAVIPRGAGAATPALSLTGRVTVSGRTAGYVPVILPRAVNLRSEIGRPTATFAGGAYGWLLVSATTPKGRGFAGATRVPGALGGSTVFRIDGKDPRTGAQLFETATLSPGSYRLYLLTNGPGSVTFRLPGLPGARTVAPTTRTAVATKTMTAPTANGIAPPAYAMGVTFGGDAPSLALSYHYVKSTAQAAAHYGWCTYDGGPPGGHWVPGCPGADVVIIGAYAPAVGCCGVGTGGGFFDGGRTWGYGRFYDTAGVMEQAADFYVVVPVG